MQAIVQDVESSALIDPSGLTVDCRRTPISPLFALAIGEFGLLGIIVTVRLRLLQGKRLRRQVFITTLDRLMKYIDAGQVEGYLSGYFQCMTGEHAPLFMHTGFFACYVPVGAEEPLHEPQRRLAQNDWRTVDRLAHTYHAGLYRMDSPFCLATDGTVA